MSFQNSKTSVFTGGGTGADYAFGAVALRFLRFSQEEFDITQIDPCVYEVSIKDAILDQTSDVHYAFGDIVLTASNVAELDNTANGLDLATVPNGGAIDYDYQHEIEFFLNGQRIYLDRDYSLSVNKIKAFTPLVTFAVGDVLSFKFRKV